MAGWREFADRAWPCHDSSPGGAHGRADQHPEHPGPSHEWIVRDEVPHAGWANPGGERSGAIASRRPRVALHLDVGARRELLTRFRPTSVVRRGSKNKL